MEIEGPISLGVLDRRVGTSRALHIKLRPEFRDLPLERPGVDFAAYVTELG